MNPLSPSAATPTGISARASINSTHGQPLYRFLRMTKNRLCAGISTAEIRSRPFGVCTSLHEDVYKRQCMVLALGEDLTHLLPRIVTPTLLIWGRDDTATPLSDGKRMEALLPDAGLVELPGGHYAFAESFGTCARVLDSFLG